MSSWVADRNASIHANCQPSGISTVPLQPLQLRESVSFEILRSWCSISSTERWYTIYNSIYVRTEPHDSCCRALKKWQNADNFFCDHRSSGVIFASRTSSGGTRSTICSIINGFFLWLKKIKQTAEAALELKQPKKSKCLTPHRRLGNALTSRGQLALEISFLLSVACKLRGSAVFVWWSNYKYSTVVRASRHKRLRWGTCILL